jgi:hypothetical protein
MIHLAIIIYFTHLTGVGIGWLCEPPQPVETAQAWVASHPEPYLGAFRVMRDDDPGYPDTLKACVATQRALGLQ